MAFLPERQALKKAFSELGVDEKSVVETLGKLDARDLKVFNGSTPRFTEVTGARYYQRIADYGGHEMQTCFLHLHRALELWTQHPFERDARILKSAFEDKVFPKMVFVEVCCTRTPAELIGVKMTYSAMYKTTVEQDVQSYYPSTFEQKFLKELLLNGPYEMTLCDTKEAKRDSDRLFNRLRHHIRDEEKRVIDLIVHESKDYINIVFESYKKMHKVQIEQDMENYEIMGVILQCRFDRASYFCKLFESSFATNDEDILTRVIVTRADVDMSNIKEAFLDKTGIPLDQKIEDVVHGNYKEFLLTLIKRSN